jgi:hypothetical protein
VGLRGPKPRSVEEHIARGSYRRSRHGPKPERSLEATDPYTDDWIKEAWRLLRLPGGPPRPLSLDPIEELLEREGIEVTDEDRKPESPAATSDAREADTVAPGDRERANRRRSPLAGWSRFSRAIR